MHIIIFEDAYVSNLYPASTARPAFALNVGTYTLLDLLKKWDAQTEIEAVVRPHLREIVRRDYSEIWRFEPGKERRGNVLILNARIVPHVRLLETLKTLIKNGRQGVIHHGQDVVCAYLTSSVLPNQIIGGSQLLGLIDDLHLDRLDADIPMLSYAHDLIRYQMSVFNSNLEERLRTGDYKEIADGVFAADDVKIGQHLVTDTSHGAILIESGASIGPFCYLHGPVYIGKKSRVIEYAMLKEYVTIGHTTKIGGEVEASIVEPYTNKQHHGFLGHSYLGSWINLGAGTCNSDLKNTYGEVTMEYNGIKKGTGMQFVGCIVGDYSKTAINTSIFTGKVIGVCSMVYGFVTTNVPSFVNYARSFGQVTEAPVDIMIQTQSRMFKRRHVEQSQCDVQLLRDMFELTRHERQLADEPLSL
jgi:glucose-1-phosphate thymidylyltransferase